MVAFLAMVVAALLAATPAWASSVKDVDVTVFGNRVGEQAGYTVSLIATSALWGTSYRSASSRSPRRPTPCSPTPRRGTPPRLS
jgi:hypothetical protein